MDEGTGMARRPYGEDEDQRRKSEIDRMFAEFEPKFPKAPVITCEELAQDMRDNSKPLVVVDVRTKEEQNVSVIKSAIRKEDFEALKSEFTDHKVVAYCTIGYRSGDYVQKLRAQNFEAYNLKGSILAWTHSGGELEEGATDGGGPTRRIHTFGKDWDLASTNFEAEYFQTPVVTYLSGLVPDVLKPWTWFKKK